MVDSYVYGSAMIYPFTTFDSVSCPLLHSWEKHYERLNIGTIRMQMPNGTVELAVNKSDHMDELQLLSYEEEEAYIQGNPHIFRG